MPFTAKELPPPASHPPNEKSMTLHPFLSQALLLKHLVEGHMLSNYWNAGTSTLMIRETQQKQWHEDGSLTVNSEPVLEFVGGSKFTTAAEFTVQAEGSGCKVPSTRRRACAIFLMLHMPVAPVISLGMCVLHRNSRCRHRSFTASD